jgi:hypothetical protein
MVNGGVIAHGSLVRTLSNVAGEKHIGLATNILILLLHRAFQLISARSVAEVSLSFPCQKKLSP